MSEPVDDGATGSPGGPSSTDSLIGEDLLC